MVLSDYHVVPGVEDRRALELAAVKSLEKSIQVVNTVRVSSVADKLRRGIDVEPVAKLEALDVERRDQEFTQAASQAGIFLSPRSGQIQATQPWFYGTDSFVAVTNKFCSGNPDQCAAVAVPGSGQEIVSQQIVSDNADVWGFAGLGVWWRPQAPVVDSVEFRALMYWSYNYQLRCATDTAHSRGEIGLRVFSWNSQGQDQREISTVHPLWAYGVDFWDGDHGDHGDDHTNLVLGFHPERGRSYLCTAYVFAASDGNGWPGSQAVTAVSATQGWLVTQDWAFV